MKSYCLNKRSERSKSSRSLFTFRQSRVARTQTKQKKTRILDTLTFELISCLKIWILQSCKLFVLDLNTSHPDFYSNLRTEIQEILNKNRSIQKALSNIVKVVIIPKPNDLQSKNSSFDQNHDFYFSPRFEAATQTLKNVLEFQELAILIAVIRLGRSTEKIWAGKMDDLKKWLSKWLRWWFSLEKSGLGFGSR